MNPNLSIVIPSFNSATWLPSTISSIQLALKKCELKTEILLVDDGSTDDTKIVVDQIAASSIVPIRYIQKSNQGVYEAVRTGALEARSTRLLIVNSRLLVEPNAFAYLQSQMSHETTIETRNGHVETSNEVPIVGRFWEVPTHVFWGRYLREPKLTKITEKNFDRVPKGTGFLVVAKDRLLAGYDAMGDLTDRFVSDDTKLLRYLASERPILLDPEFKATYRPRTTVRKFLAHGFLRGTLFVDSYYDTSWVRNFSLWALALGIPIAVFIMLVSMMNHHLFWASLPVGLFSLLVLVLVTVAKINRAPSQAIGAFIVYVIPFIFVFWFGVCRGIIIRFRKKLS